MVGVGARRFAEHQNILTDYYVSKTRLIALDFAKKLAAKVFVEFGKMDADISAFGQKINDAIDESERLVTAQRKVNKGLEDMKGAIIEVSEDEAMKDFETELKADKIDMPNIARQLRESILPQGDFTNFGNLANDISVDGIKDAFDIKLSKIVKTKHDEKADSDQKVLGLNILTQLRQKLKTDDDIKQFAYKIVNQSGVYLKLNNDQIQLNLRNNEGILSPQNLASINKKTILVSIPSSDSNQTLGDFSQKLETALMSHMKPGAGLGIRVNKNSPRKDELSIITVGYCFPMRAIEWMKPYKEKYERFLHTGNAATDTSNAILLHSEGNGSQLPRLFAASDEEIGIAIKEGEKQNQPESTHTTSTTGSTVQPIHNDGVTLPPPPPQEPELKLYLAVAGKQYGPYTRENCKQLVEDKRLTQESLVWMEGMAGWEKAGQVEALKSLFAPATPPVPPVPGPGMPPMPPIQ